MNSKKYVFGIAAAFLLAVAPASKAGILLDFDSGSGNSAGYFQGGFSFVTLSNHVHYGTNPNDSSTSFEIHGGGCCSSPYQLTFGGSPFTLTSLEVVALDPEGSGGSETTFSSSAGGYMVADSLGTLNFTGPDWTNVTWVNWEADSLNSGNNSLGIDNVAVSAVPEPGTLFLVGGAIAGVMLRRRKRLA